MWLCEFPEGVLQIKETYPEYTLGGFLFFSPPSEAHRTRVLYLGTSCFVI